MRENASRILAHQRSRRPELNTFPGPLIRPVLKPTSAAPTYGQLIYASGTDNRLFKAKLPASTPELQIITTDEVK